MVVIIYAGMGKKEVGKGKGKGKGVGKEERGERFH